MDKPKREDFEVTDFVNTGYYEKIPGPRDGKTGLYIEALEKYIEQSLTVREVMEWMKNNKKWLKVHSTGEVETNIASGHFISLDELKKLIRG